MRVIWSRKAFLRKYSILIRLGKINLCNENKKRGRLQLSYEMKTYLHGPREKNHSQEE